MIKITDEIARHLIEVHTGNNWTWATIKEVLADVSWEEANTVTPASTNTIASVLYHISFYNRVVSERLMGNKPVVNEANGFDMPPLAGATGWENLKNDNLRSAEILAEQIRSLNDEVLGQYLPDHPDISWYKELHGVIEHAHYHLGQIMMLKKLVKPGHT